MNIRHGIPRGLLTVAGLSLLLALSGCGRGGQNTTSGPQQGRPQISDRGPGMRRQPATPVQLPVPRTFDLTHVEPKHFAAALGNDPVRIFEFVRDQIAYEAYTGYLRGPRGTLLAMAGNSVDRAALLASLLQEAGHRVRYARGTLPDREARDLVTSMWTKRPDPVLRVAEGPGTAEAQAAAQTLLSSARRDYTRIREHLVKGKGQAASPEPSLDALVGEARSHFWLQWLKDGGWTDLDPSFADSSPGRSYAPAQETVDALPPSLQHRVTLRIRLEEYKGDTPTVREVLTLSAAAADLSGRDLVLLHLPENWQSPAESLEGAISSAVENTGRIKAVLLTTGDQFLTSDAFAQKLKTTGIGAVGPLLSGEGTRNAATLATAEWIEFEFIAPDGQRQAVVREIFDLVGKTRRSAGQTLSAEEVRARTESASAFDLSRTAYDLLFMTGGLDVGHLSELSDDPPQGYADVRSALRRLGVAFTATSDSLLPRVGRPERTVVLFYPDSPRVMISELTNQAGGKRIALDLRRNHVRAVGMGSHLEDVFIARIARGVTEGTVERLLGAYVTPNARESGAVAPAVSTSLVFEHAAAEGISTVLLPSEMDRLAWDGQEEALTALKKETADGYLAVAPQRPLAIGGAPRLAWWRIDPRSGETTAVTDEGLHAVAVEYHTVKNTKTGETHVVRMEFVGNRLVGDEMRTFATGSQNLARYVSELVDEGASLGSTFAF